MQTVTRPRPRIIASLPPLLANSAADTETTSQPEAFPKACALPPMPVDRAELSFVLDPRHGTSIDPRPFVTRAS